MYLCVLYVCNFFVCGIFYDTGPIWRTFWWFFKVPPVDKAYVFSDVEFSGESENQRRIGKFSSENTFYSVLLTFV